VLQKINGDLVVMGNVPASGTELGKSLSTTNFQSLGPKAQSPAVAQAPAIPAPASTGTTAKP